MHVLYIHQHFSTPSGCGGTRSYEFARALIAKGHQVTMVCGSHQLADTGLRGPFKRKRREGYVDGIRVIEFQVTYSNKDNFVLRAWKFLVFSLRNIGVVLREKYDILYATSTPLTTAIPGIVSKKIKSKIPFIFEIRDLWPELPREMGVITNPIILKLMDALERSAYKHADKGVGLAPGICKGMQRFNTLTENDINFIPNGCDNEYFNEIMDDSALTNLPDALQKLLKSKHFTAVFTGAHGIANGLDSALDAAVILKAMGITNIQLIFIGDGKMKAFLMKRAQDEKLNNCYFFDPIPKNNLRWVLKQANVGLMLLKNIPAFYNGTSPNKFFDYISVGLPVINNYPGWVADMLIENQCGLSVPPDNPKALAQALIKFSNYSSEELAAQGTRSYKLAKEKFDRAYLAEKFVSLCESYL